MNYKILLLNIVLLFLAARLPIFAAGPMDITSLDGVMSQLANNQDAMEIFLNSLSSTDLVHWSQTSRLYRQLFKDELLKRKNLVDWAVRDLKNAIIKCDDCAYVAIVFSNDGKKIAGCGRAAQGAAIQIFDVASLRVERTVSLPVGMVNSLCFSPDNKMLAASNGLDKILLFDVYSGVQLFEVVGWRMIFLPDNTLLTITHDGNLFKWDIKTGKKIGSLVLEQGELIKKLFMKIAFSPDGQKIVGGSDHNIIVWSCENGKRIKEFPSMPISALIFSPDGKVLACKNTFFIKLLDVKTGRDLKILHGDFLSMAFFPDNRVLVTAKRMESRKISIQLWHIRTGQIINDLSDDSLVGSVVLSVSSEGKILAASSGKQILLWYRNND